MAARSLAVVLALLFANAMGYALEPWLGAHGSFVPYLVASTVVAMVATACHHLTILRRKEKDLSDGIGSAAEAGTEGAGNTAPESSGDTSERLQAQREMRLQGARLAATLDVLVDPVVYVDSSGRVRLANSASTRLLSKVLADQGTGSWSAHLLADFLSGPASLDTLHGALASGASVRNRQVDFIDAEGEARVALASIVPVVDAGLVQGIVISIHDITENQALAAELEATNIELRNRFEELLEQQEVLAVKSEEAARHRAQLAERNADLTSASRLKSEFLATMSHELRTPLNAVIGFAEVLLADHAHPLTDDHRACVLDIRMAGEQLLLLIEDVLDLTRIEAGRLQIQTERMDLALPLLQARELTSALARERSVTVNSELTLGLLFVAADPNRVRQIALNLLSNALKFTPSGGTVTLRLVALPGRLVRASVTDTGVGIASDDVDRLFTPFTQFENGQSRRRGGTGLGLAISRQLAEAMNGTIGCESVLGRGSNFYFTLPQESDDIALGTEEVRVSPAGTTAVGPEGESPEAQPFARGWGPKRTPEPVSSQPVAARPTLPTSASPERLHVLIVDDNAVNRRVLRSMLASSGCDLSEAEDGPTAIHAAHLLRPGVILMDIQMPEMDGLTATSILRADPETAGIPVVAITAHGLPGDPERAAEAGCVGYLAKPVGRERLMTAISKAVGRDNWR